MHVTLRTLDTSEPASLSGVRLVERSGQMYLLVARGTALFEAQMPPPNTSGPLVFAGAGTLGGFTSWDAKPVPGQKGSYATVYVRAESAVAWAMFRSPSSPLDARLHFEAFAVYDHPKFVKGQQPNQWSVTAIQYAQGKSIPVVFPRDGITSDDPPAVSVGRYSPTVQDARLVRSRAHFWLLLQMLEPSAFAGTAVTQPSGIGRKPGVLNAVQLDATLQPTTSPTRVFGATPIYEFDADAARDGQVVVFATTREGALLFCAALVPGKPAAAHAWSVTKLQTPLTSPTVLVQQGWIHVAALAAKGSQESAVLYGAMPLP